ncbi:MAG: hypothetical protein QNJ54_26650 [Prochloraceae cyanobacterium]|nr:hypothetical protein [Prochloraceae cyanobacterium]
MTSIIVNSNISVEKGPQINVPASQITVNAINKIAIELDTTNTTNTTNNTTFVEVQPGKKVEFLLIQSSQYTSTNPAQKIMYAIDYSTQPPNDPPAPEQIHLDKPQVYQGKGVISSLFPGGVQKIWFKNGLTEKVTLEILVGRDATS